MAEVREPSPDDDVIVVTSVASYCRIGTRWWRVGPYGKDTGPYAWTDIGDPSARIYVHASRLAAVEAELAEAQRDDLLAENEQSRRSPTMPETKKRGWDCWMDDCARTVRDGPLVRVNPKGEHGVFMCADHAAEVWIMRSGATEETDRDRAAGTGIYRPRDGNAEVGPYADPDFQPGMVVCAADRDRNDMRTWEAFQPEDAEPGEWLFDALWRTTTVRWDKREDLPGRAATATGTAPATGGRGGICGTSTTARATTPIVRAGKPMRLLARRAVADPAVPVDHRPPLPPPNPLLGQTLDGNPARSLVDRTPLDLDAIKTRVAVREYGAARFAAGMACGTGASPDWDRADQAYAAVLDWAYAEVVPAVAS